MVILRGRNHAPDEIERAVEAVPGVRAGCAVAASWLPEDAEGEVLALFVEASRQATPAEREALPEACRAAVLGATGLAVGPGRGPRAGHPPPHLLRQAAPGRDAAPLPRRAS